MWLPLATGEPRPPRVVSSGRGPCPARGAGPAASLPARPRDTVRDGLLGSVAVLAVACGPESASESLLPTTKPCRQHRHQASKPRCVPAPLVGRRTKAGPVPAPCPLVLSRCFQFLAGASRSASGTPWGASLGDRPTSPAPKPTPIRTSQSRCLPRAPAQCVCPATPRPRPALRHSREGLRELGGGAVVSGGQWGDSPYSVLPTALPVAVMS